MWEQSPLPWQAALEEAWAAYCAGSLPIGAALIDADGLLIARGRNRLLDSAADGDPTHLRRHTMAHAELNALITFGQKQLDPRTITLYTTLEPCAMCMGATIASGIKTIAFLVPDPLRGAGDLPAATERMRAQGIRVLGPQPDMLGNLAIALLVARMLQVGPLPVLPPTMAEAFAYGIALGETLFHNGTLEQRCAQQATAAHILADLMP
jgi:tRNA(adenine34) deaminase